MCLAVRWFAALTLLSQLTLFGQSPLQIMNADLFLMATDPSSGNLVLAGRTNEPFRVPANAFQVRAGGGNCQGRLCNDVVVVKIRPADGQIVAATLLGGGSEDSPTALVVDGSGNVYVVGTTSSRNFHATEGAFKRTTTSASTSFVTKLNPSLTGVEFSTYLGGRGNDRISAMAVDSQGFVYVSGTTDSTDFPIVEPSFQKTHTPGIIFVTKLNSGGTGLVASTFLGQGSVANISAGLGGVTITGTTSSDRFPVTPDAVQTRKPASPITHSDGFVTRMPLSLNSLLYSTYFGGSQNDVVVDSEVDAEGSVYITGTSFSRDFPLTIADAAIGTAGTAFVAKFNLLGLAYARALRGNNSTTALGLDLAPGGAPYVIGFSTGTHFPTTPGAYRRCIPATSTGGPFPFYTRLDRDGGFAYSTLFESPLYESRHLTANAGTGELFLLSFIPAPPSTPFVLASLPVNVVRRFDFTASPGARVDCVVNASTYAPSAVSGGLVVTIFGNGMGPAAGVGGTVESGRVTTAVGGVRVLFDGVPAPILYARQDQVNAIVPFSVANQGTAQMIVENGGVPIGPLALPVRLTLPGIFRIGATEQAVVLNEDGTVNSPDNPAARGSIVTFWITGFGQYEAAAADGVITTDLSSVRLPVAVTFQNQRAELLYAGSAPGMVAGVAQVNARVPASAPASLRVPVSLTIGPDGSQNSAYISLK